MKFASDFDEMHCFLLKQMQDVEDNLTQKFNRQIKALNQQFDKLARS